MDIYISPNVEVEKAFWRYVNSRQHAWHRRNVLMTDRADWSDDNIISEYRLPNVYRELSTHTLFCVWQIIERARTMTEHVAYRLLVTHEAHQMVASNVELLLIGGDEGRDALRDVVEHYSASTSLLRGKGTDAVMESLEYIAKWERDHTTKTSARMAFSLNDLEGLTRSMSDELGVSELVAYQVALDMTIPLAYLKGSTLAPFASPDDWVMIGTKATWSLTQMGVVGRARLPKALRDMRDRQRHAFDDLELDFPFIKRRDGSDVELSLANIEYALAGFSQYLKIERGGRGKKFIPSARPYWHPAAVPSIPAYGVNKE